MIIYGNLSAVSMAWFMADMNSLFSLFSPRSMRSTTHLSTFSTVIPFTAADPLTERDMGRDKTRRRVDACARGEVKLKKG